MKLGVLKLNLSYQINYIYIAKNQINMNNKKLFFIITLVSTLFLNSCYEEVEKPKQPNYELIKVPYTFEDYHNDHYDPSFKPSAEYLSWSNYMLRLPKDCNEVENIYNINFNLKSIDDAIAFEKSIHSKLVLNSDDFKNITSNRNSNLIIKELDPIKVFK